MMECKFSKSRNQDEGAIRILMVKRCQRLGVYHYVGWIIHKDGEEAVIWRFDENGVFGILCLIE